MASTDVNTSSNKESSKQLQKDNQPAIEEKYSPDEIDAAYALLALSNSAPAPPPSYERVTVKPGANSTGAAKDDKLPSTSQTSHQASLQIYTCQVSPLAELNSFVAAALPNGDGKTAFNSDSYSTSQLRDLTVWRCKNHSVWGCQQCFHAVNP